MSPWKPMRQIFQTIRPWRPATTMKLSHLSIEHLSHMLNHAMTFAHNTGSFLIDKILFICKCGWIFQTPSNIYGSTTSLRYAVHVTSCVSLTLQLAAVMFLSGGCVFGHLLSCVHRHGRFFVHLKKLFGRIMKKSFCWTKSKTSFFKYFSLSEFVQFPLYSTILW